ncbi:MAG: serine/threonine-protein kinase [Myxococcales bacterium]
MVVEAVGRYGLQRKLANGNMGEVFLAEYSGEAGFRRRVVVKRLFQHLAHHPEAVRMFQDEAHVLSALNHPNIPQIYDLGYAEGHWYLVIEHVPGFTLAELCAAGAREGIPMPFDAVVSAVEQLCDALHHAHERNDDEGRPMRIVHRDVTPHNVMITPDGFAKLLDFGVAHTARDEAHSGTIKGTLAYMAPEQVRGQRIDKRSDVFAVGVMLYELTTGRRLFHGGEIEVMTAIVERDVTPPSHWVPGYPQELEFIVLTALSRDRGRRYPSALHLAHALEDYALSTGVSPNHQALARYYQQVFREDERLARGHGSYRPIPITPSQGNAVRHPPSNQPPQSAAVAGRHGRAHLHELHALRGEPALEPVVEDMVELEEAPQALLLPLELDDDLLVEEAPPIVLARPKR